MTAHRERIPVDRIDEVVVDDSMIRRVQTSNDGVVIRESQRREDRNQTGCGLRSVIDETADVRCVNLVPVTKSEAIRGDEENDWVREGYY